MNENLGTGAMLHLLSGGPYLTNRAITQALGKTIHQVLLEESANRLFIFFTDRSLLTVFDDGQSCCERRYMRTDDDLIEYTGYVLLGFELKSVSTTRDEDWGDVHQIQFLDVITSNGTFQIANHNEHNGYYGGFAVTAEYDDSQCTNE